MGSDISEKECGLGVVHPWLCDSMGHMSARHYLGFFDDAQHQFFFSLGYDPRAGEREALGWADVRHDITYLSELRAGDLVKVFGRVVRTGRTSISTFYRMVNSASLQECGTLSSKTVCLDLNTRKARHIPHDILHNARLLSID